MEALRTMAHCFETGLGTSKDPLQALVCWEKLTEMEDPEACQKFGEEMLTGKYKSIDLKCGFALLQKSTVF